MARELSQEAVLDFLCGAGGRAPNSALLRHFQRFLRDPALSDRQRRERRERFKSIVNSLATVRPAAGPAASKDIVLRRRYRDLLDEDLRPDDEAPPPPRRDPVPGEAAKERPAGAAGAGAAGAGGCTARGGPCCECRRALRAAPGTPGTPGTRGRAPHPTRRDRSPPLPPRAPDTAMPPSIAPSPAPATGPRGAPVPAPAMPQRVTLRPVPPAAAGPRCHRAAPAPRSAAPPADPARHAAGPGGQHPTGASRCPRPPPSLPVHSAPEVLSSPRSLPLRFTPGAPSLSRSLQELPATPSPRPPSGPSSRLLPSQSRSLQQLPTGPPRSPLRAPRALTHNGPTQAQVLLLYPYQNPPLPSDPEVLPPARPPPPQSPPQSSTQPSPSRSLQPPPARPPLSQALLPAAGPRAPESSPPASLPVFRSIRCQLALLEEQGIPPSLSDDSGRQPRTVPSKSTPRNVPSRGLSVPLGQREHAWLVAVSAGRWARVRGLFQEEPELALQRDFMSGFTVLHWLAKHGDGPGLQELAAAARQAGLVLDVDARSGCGYTPLHLAAIHGHQFVIKVLVLQLGCQVRVRDGSGRRPWEYLGSSTSGEIWQLLEAPPGTIMFPTEPLTCSTSSASKASLPPGKAALPACLRPHSRGAASHRTGNKSD
ncbi:ankyrin repeat domain-containing protein SOWAHB [Phaenicophaeus curvirostris]|uniref:ankyrin repeat domain-containing protein SOWAHB n=1 Tax=Phaenicophaeus curvirostris TaxID=33595 RepID=UPI0037F0EE36